MGFEVRKFWERRQKVLDGELSPQGALGQQIDQRIARQISGKFKALMGEADYLRQHNACVTGITGYYHRLPKGKTVVAMWPGLNPRFPLADMAEVCVDRQAAAVASLGHHLGGIKDGVSVRMREYYSEASVRRHLQAAGAPNLKFVCQPHDIHTGTQAEALVDWTIEHGWDGMVIALMAAPGHLFSRGYGTAAMAFLKRDMFVPIVPVPHAIDPITPTVPNFSAEEADDIGTDCNQLDFNEGELDRIFDMSRKDPPDVTPLDLLKDYVSRTAQHPLLQGA